MPAEKGGLYEDSVGFDFLFLYHCIVHSWSRLNAGFVPYLAGAWNLLSLNICST